VQRGHAYISLHQESLTPPPDATNRDVLFEGVPVTNMTIYNAFTPAYDDLADYGYSARTHGDLDTMWAYNWNDAAQSGGYGFLNYTSDLTWNRCLEDAATTQPGVYTPTAAYRDIQSVNDSLDDGGTTTTRTATAKVIDASIWLAPQYAAVNTTHTAWGLISPNLESTYGQLYTWTRGTSPDCLRFVYNGKECDYTTTSGETLDSISFVTKAPGVWPLTLTYRTPYDELAETLIS